MQNDSSGKGYSGHGTLNHQYLNFDKKVIWEKRARTFEGSLEFFKYSIPYLEEIDTIWSVETDNLNVFKEELEGYWTKNFYFKINGKTGIRDFMGKQYYCLPKDILVRHDNWTFALDNNELAILVEKNSHSEDSSNDDLFYSTDISYENFEVKKIEPQDGFEETYYIVNSKDSLDIISITRTNECTVKRHPIKVLDKIKELEVQQNSVWNFTIDRINRNLLLINNYKADEIILEEDKYPYLNEDGSDSLDLDGNIVYPSPDAGFSRSGVFDLKKKEWITPAKYHQIELKVNEFKAEQPLRNEHFNLIGKEEVILDKKGSVVSVSSIGDNYLLNQTSAQKKNEITFFEDIIADTSFLCHYFYQDTIDRTSEYYQNLLEYYKSLIYYEFDGKTGIYSTHFNTIVHESQKEIFIFPKRGEEIIIKLRNDTVVVIKYSDTLVLKKDGVPSFKGDTDNYNVIPFNISNQDIFSLSINESITFYDKADYRHDFTQLIEKNIEIPDPAQVIYRVEKISDELLNITDYSKSYTFSQPKSKEDCFDNLNGYCYYEFGNYSYMRSGIYDFKNEKWLISKKYLDIRYESEHFVAHTYKDSLHAYDVYNKKGNIIFTFERKNPNFNTNLELLAFSKTGQYYLAKFSDEKVICFDSKSSTIKEDYIYFLPEKWLKKIFKNKNLTNVASNDTLHSHINNFYDGVYLVRNNNDLDSGSYKYGEKIGEWNSTYCINEKIFYYYKSNFSIDENGNKLFEYQILDDTLATRGYGSATFNPSNGDFLKGKFYVLDFIYGGVFDEFIRVDTLKFEVKKSSGLLTVIYSKNNNLIENRGFKSNWFAQLNYNNTNEIFKFNFTDLSINYFTIDPRTDGESFYYGYKNGNLSEHTLYKKGLRNGLSVHFDYRGFMSDSLHYKNDSLNGLAAYYYDNGQLRSKGNYFNNKEVGIWHYYNVFGEVTSEVNYDNHSTVLEKKINVINSVHAKTQLCYIISENKKFALTNNDVIEQRYDLWDLSKRKIINQNIKIDLYEQFGGDGDVPYKQRIGMDDIVLTDDGKRYYNEYYSLFQTYDIQTGLPDSLRDNPISNKVFNGYDNYFHWVPKENNYNKEKRLQREVTFQTKILSFDQDSSHVFVLTEDSIIRYSKNTESIDLAIKYEASNYRTVHKFYKNKLYTLNYNATFEYSNTDWADTITPLKISVFDLFSRKTKSYDLSGVSSKLFEIDTTFWLVQIEIVLFETDKEMEFIFRLDDPSQYRHKTSKIISIEKNGKIEEYGLNEELVYKTGNYFIYNKYGFLWYDWTRKTVEQEMPFTESIKNIYFEDQNLIYQYYDPNNSRKSDKTLKTINLGTLAFSYQPFSVFIDTINLEFDKQVELLDDKLAFDKEFSLSNYNHSYHELTSFDNYVNNDNENWQSYRSFLSSDKSNSVLTWGYHKKVLLVNHNKVIPKERYVSLITTKNNNYVFYTPEYYYSGTKNVGDILHFMKDGIPYSLEQFDLKHNRPDIILDRLGYADSSLVNAYHAAYQRRLKKMGFTEDMLKDDFHLPEIKIENYEEMPTLHDQGSIDLKLKLEDTKYKLDRINVWVNDVAIYGVNGISLRDKNIQDYSTTLTVDLAKGKNKVQVSVLNQAGAESYKETFEIECSVGKTIPDLYLITIGVSEFEQTDFNLTYAAKDAQDMTTLFQKSKAYKNVFTKTLLNQDVTKENVLALKSFLAEASINDEVMVFIAGHGVLDANLDYYLATYDMDFSNPKDKGLAYDDLESLQDAIKPLKKTLLIDACHSGEIDKDEIKLAVADKAETGEIQFRAVGNSIQPKLGIQNTSELTKSLFTDLRKGTGATVISSAGGMEFAMESADWKNGLFTYCLLNGITSKKADLNNDGEIWLSELQKYVAEQVTKLSNGQQQPTSRIENQTVDFRVW